MASNSLSEDLSGSVESPASSSRRVSYVFSPELMRLSSLLPSNPQRSTSIHQLVAAFGLLEDGEVVEELLGDGFMLPEDAASENGQQKKAELEEPLLATLGQLSKGHDRDFVELLLDPKLSSLDASDSPLQSPSPSESSSTSSSSSDERRPTKRRRVGKLAAAGLEDDCPPFDELWKYVPIVAGASIAAARLLRERRTDVAICWDGGRHHAFRSKASGFCYVNDCVLAILELQSRRTSLEVVPFKKPRVMYIDIDVHHGDGVAESFLSPMLSTSSKKSKPPSILTLSIHHAASGFFPASELSQLTSPTTDHPHTLSVPLHAGASNPTFAKIFSSVIEKIKTAFDPQFVVLQCGVDGLAGDKVGVWNWSTHGEGSMGWVTQKILDWKLPTLLLGGGGYNTPNASRAFAYFTSIALGRGLEASTPIPHTENFPSYQPSFELEVQAGGAQDKNNQPYLDQIAIAFDQLADRINTLREGTT